MIDTRGISPVSGPPGVDTVSERLVLMKWEKMSIIGN